MLRFFSNLFPMPPSKKMIQKRKDRTIGALIQRFANGNVRIQGGHYATSDDIAKLRKKVLSRNC